MADKIQDVAIDLGEVPHPLHILPRKKPLRLKPRVPMLTPMIDVTFQLLLFFILTMDFRKSEGQIPSDLPVTEGPGAIAAVAPLDPVTIFLRPAADGAEGVDIEISRYNLVIRDWQGLYDALCRLRGQFGTAVPVVIRPSQQASWADALNAFQQAQRARFEHIAFARQPEKG
jgi:biopolymer transport protein ExbD